MTEDLKVEKEFMSALRENVRYWERQKGTTKECMEGLTFSILVMLDGMSGSFEGNIEDLKDKNTMLHDMFYEQNEKQDD